ncbi:MAG: hypothetical protein ABSF89_17370 [Acidimicrobiales bacterium]|jgi:hypothetical protein
MRADTEAEVVALLHEAGYWDDPGAWRLFGDNDNNYAPIGNQQSEAIAALIEKVINGIDARLMNACREHGIDPESPDAPRSMREAVARFFEGKAALSSEVGGRISSWPDEKSTAEGRLLTVAATGNMPKDGQFSISIADQGEGQEPDSFPTTFMSLQRNNKLHVFFVQGKFNMGGTGALQFCSPEHNLQLIVSRRNPDLVDPNANKRAHEWGFSIVRREWPKDGRSSVYTYLAPEGASQNSHKGGTLAFSAASLPIFPEANDKVRNAYHRHAGYGTLVKLYEYQWSGTHSNIIFSRGGLLQRLELGLPEVALPVRVFECRPDYVGHEASFATNVLGLASRLERDKATNIEPGFPVGSILQIDGCEVKVKIFAFKPDKAQAYRTPRHGVVFAVNGQAHGAFSADFFRRKSVGMSYLADSILVLVDCSAVVGRMREDLFMNSRDRLRLSPLAHRIEVELEVLLKNDPTLKALRNSRREVELAEKLADSKPLVKVLQDLIKKSPTLAKLFLQGVKLSSPFPPGGGTGEGAGGDFQGKTYPTFFRFKRVSPGETLIRDAHRDSRVRLAIETDAADDYFLRELDPGASRLLALDEDDEWTEVTTDWIMSNPKSGSAGLTIIGLPDEVVDGDELSFHLETTDPSQIEAFVNEFVLRVRPPADSPTGGRTASSSVKNAGTGQSGGSSTLELPKVVEVTEELWVQHGFSELTALKVINAGQTAGEVEDTDIGATDVYDFFVNVDNKFLRITQKESKQDPKLLKAKFVYSLVLIGLALIQEDRTIRPADRDNDESDSDERDNKDEGGGGTLERSVDVTTRAVAPILLPMLELIGALDSSEED